MKTARDKNKSLRLGLICLMLCVLTVISFNGIVTVSKYVLSLNSSYKQANAKAFYFTSDLLAAGDTPVYQIANFVPGTNTISFFLRNYADELRVSETDIAYTISTDNSSINGSSDEITLNGASPVDHPVSLSVPASAFTDINGKVTVRVTATADEPYSASLSAVFELYRYNTDIQLSVYDDIGNNTLTLTITTGDSAAPVSITFPSAVYPDRTDGRLTVDGSTTCHFTGIAANAQYSFVFFKSNPNLTYSVSDFSVS